MRQVIVAIDVVGSTAAKEIYGETHACKLIEEALSLAEASLVRADPSLHSNGPSAGDSLLLVAGTEALPIYRAAVVHQSEFISWCYNRLPVKISIGHGDFESKEGGGYVNYRGRDLDFLHRICDVCPAAGVVVTPAMYALLHEAGFGGRLIERKEDLQGFGTRVFYESDGDYRIPPDQRQRIGRDADTDTSPVLQPVIEQVEKVKKQSWVERYRVAMPLLLVSLIVLVLYLVFRP